MRFGSIWISAWLTRIVVLGVVAGWAGCSTSTEGLPKVDPGDNGGAGGNAIDAPVDEGPDGGRQPSESCEPPEILKELGRECGCNEECEAGSCVDGVCCTGSCDGTCMACNVPGKMGACSPIPAGMNPVVKGQCDLDDVATCGYDGTCDGSGGCRKYLDGTVCEQGVCEGATVTSIKVCTEGACAAGPNQVCTPFGCNPATGSCFDQCTGNNQCSIGRDCRDGSCGLKKSGANCQKNSDCESNSCADGVCCNTACTGACESCNQVGMKGECAPVPRDLPDPHGICTDEGPNSCKSSGVCDGKGSCAKYAAGTTCGAARCEGGSLLPASSCDGTGSCRAGAPIPCAPSICEGNACVAVCTSNAQCVGGNTCQNGSCGKKGNGQDCTANNQCGSNFCIDGVCCENACNGYCRSCALTGSKGRCLNVGAGAPDPRAAAGNRDPAQVCLDEGAAGCDRNGMCNGNGGCQLYAQGTMCKAQSCDVGSNAYTRSSTCDGAGTCAAGTSSGCAPYRCNGTACGDACGGNADCVSPNTCDATGSCGKKALKAMCAGDAECLSGNCEQGTCCATKCEGSCFSCSTAAKPGECVAVPVGAPDPARVCTDQGAAGCKNNGVCNGSGACQKYAAGTICAAAFCSGDVEQQTSTCDGLGSCQAGARMSCDTFVCNGGGTACFDSCANDNQCSGDNSCVAQSCGKKGQGASCSNNGQCTSNFCADGFCCDKKCDGLCETCKLGGSQGTCSPVGAGVADDNSTCTASDPNQCGDNGKCDGARGCQDWDAATVCRLASCPSGGATLTLPANCNNGSCPAVATQSCGTYKCNPSTQTSCLSGTCQSSADCSGGNVCSLAGMSMTCGLKPLGSGCEQGLECASGKCTNSTCCDASACGTCKSCANASGNCQAVALNALDPGCAATGSEAACATPNGKCAANGTCQVTAMGTNCGTTCASDGTGGQEIRNLVCNGGGTCLESSATPVSCGLNVCVGGACNMPCTTDAQCTRGATCQNQDNQGNGTCMPRRNDGSTCMQPSDCVNANCVSGVCCAQASCGPCHSCATGMCAAVAPGMSDAACAPGAGAGQCRTGLCGAGGTCAAFACAPVCVGGNSQARACDGAGGCANAGAPSVCAPFACDGTTGGCKIGCVDAATDCVAGKACTGGLCVTPPNSPDAGE